MTASMLNPSPEHMGYLSQLGIGPTSTPWSPVVEPMPPPEELNLTPLYPYQETALARVWAAIDAGKTRIMVMLPTGGGKTVLAAHAIAHRGQQGKVSAFPVPMLNLINQTVERFEQYGLRSIGVIQGQHVRTNPNAALQVCSIQTLAARRRNGKQELKNLGLVIVDEAHLKYDDIYRLMAEWPDVVFIGLSATPWSRGLGLHWDELIVCETISGLIEWGRDHPKEGLVPFITYAPGVPDLRKVKDNIGGDDYDVGQLAKVMDKSELVGDVVKTWLEKGENRPTFCYCVDRAHAKHVNDRFIEAGVASEYMDANTALFDRKDIFDRLRSGETKVICSIGVLIAGVDEPHVSCIICARPTKSPILWTQMIGRGLRRFEGKAHLLVLDHSGNSLRVGTVDTIFFDKLHDGKKGVDLWSDEEREAAALAKVRLPKLCPECSAVVSPQETKCSQCGHEFKPVCTVRAADGELVLLGSGAQARTGPTVDEKRQFYLEALGFARQYGKKDGFAFHKYQGRFGKHEKPRWHWRDLEPLPASLATRNEIKRQAIAWQAAGRAA
jgi:DNA repair protein RadD